MRLPAESRVAIALRMLCGFSTAETVQTRIERARIGCPTSNGWPPFFRKMSPPIPAWRVVIASLHFRLGQQAAAERLAGSPCAYHCPGRSRILASPPCRLPGLMAASPPLSNAGPGKKTQSKAARAGARVVQWSSCRLAALRANTQGDRTQLCRVRAAQEAIGLAVDHVPVPEETELEPAAVLGALISTAPSGCGRPITAMSWPACDQSRLWSHSSTSSRSCCFVRTCSHGSLRPTSLGNARISNLMLAICATLRHRRRGRRASRAADEHEQHCTASHGRPPRLRANIDKTPDAIFHYCSRVVPLQTRGNGTSPGRHGHPSRPLRWHS